ncbi:MAG: divergent polysaccharide deacetylase family protein [Alphaproteobacteria bacterium]|nr:MAG: divergent polysaccharide deacetylase family protein [Alphaproteobacteria bacterium]
MPSSLNALLIAWAITIIVIFGGGVAIQLSYDPDAEHAPAKTEEHPRAQAETEPASRQQGDEPADAGMDEDEAAGHEMATGEGGNTPAAADAQMPAPGQVADIREARGVATLPKHIPVVADPDLIDNSGAGPLPRISADGRKPFDVYSAPAPTDGTKPRIAIIVTDLGQRALMTRRALADLPAAVTLAFSPYASNPIEWGEKAREAGHEVLLMVPMEPINYPQNDPGSLTLLTSMSAKENVELLKASMGRLTGYVGIVTHKGSRFTAAADSVRPMLDELKSRGLMFVDSRDSQYSRAASMATAIGLPTAYSNRFIDDDLAADEIARQLDALEVRAKAQGVAVGMGRPYPVTFDAVRQWAEGLESRGILLVPVSAVADRQPPAQ